MSQDLHRSAEPDWSRDVYQALRAADVRQAGCVPDAGLSRVIHLCQDDPTIRTVTLTTEEEGVALAAGAWLGGQRSVLLMQSSGVGNCINMLSLIRVCGFPLLAVVTMRGQWGEFNPWQVPMGQNAPEVLRLAGVASYPVGDAAAAGETVSAAANLAFNSGVGVAVLVAQRLIGTKTFKN